jgi:hypothetical protein
MSAIMLAPSPFRVSDSAFGQPADLRRALALGLLETLRAALVQSR